MRKNSQMIRWLFPFLTIAVIASYSGIFSRLAGDGAAGKYQSFRVAEIIDGDTAAVWTPNRRQRRLRYEGIDCPEIQREDSPGDPFGAEAAELNAKLLGGGNVRVLFGTERYEGYGRLLGFVFSGEKNVNKELVAAGLASVIEIGDQNPKLMSELRAAQKTAMKKRIGIWSGNGIFEPPKNQEKFIVAQKRLPQMFGRRVVVSAVVTGAREKENGMVILKTDGGAEFVIFGGSMENFRHFGISPLEHYIGKTVRVIGRVSMYRGTASIIVRHPISIYAQ